MENTPEETLKRLAYLYNQKYTWAHHPESFGKIMNDAILNVIKDASKERIED